MELFFQYQASWKRAIERLKASEENDINTIDSTLQDAGQFMIRQAHAQLYL
jgi:hypothetical protein